MRLERTRWVRGHVLHGKSGGPGSAGQPRADLEVGQQPDVGTSRVGGYENRLRRGQVRGKQPKSYVVARRRPVAYHTHARPAGLTDATDFVRKDRRSKWGEAKLKGNAFVKTGAELGAL